MRARGSAGFADRRDAGRALAAALGHLRGRPDLLVLGLSRGGVPVAAEVARSLGAELDVFVVRKLGLPSQPELAMGAIASGGIRVLNDDVVAEAGVPAEVIERVTRREETELRTRERRYRGDRPPAPIEGRTVVLVDDGLATGATMRAAVEAVRTQRPADVVVAVPVAAAETCGRLARSGVHVVCPLTPDPFVAVGQWYRDFAPVTDGEVAELVPG
jgi:predicted phosphoribosyltransferase